MITFVNAQPEDIIIKSKNATYYLHEGEKLNLALCRGETLSIHHSSFLKQSTNAGEKFIGNLMKHTVLIIDTVLQFCSEDNESIIEIRNGTYEYSTEDFGYFYFNINISKGMCSISDCIVTNKNEVLNMHIIIRMGEMLDFRPISLFSSLIKYSKIKKLCNKKSILKFLKNNSIISQF